MSASPTSSSWRSRAVIAVIALLTIVPMLLAWYYASHPELISKRSNYGRLIVPPVPIDRSELTALPASPAPISDLEGHWVLIQIGSEGCGTSCIETLHKTHQSRLMLNKEISRVRRMVVLPEDKTGWIPSTEDQQDESLLIVAVKAETLKKMAGAAGEPLREDALLLMDPLGNLMLDYPAGFDPYGLVKDLRHLLKVSQIG